MQVVSRGTAALWWKLVKWFQIVPRGTIPGVFLAPMDTVSTVPRGTLGRKPRLYFQSRIKFAAFKLLRCKMRFKDGGMR